MVSPFPVRQALEISPFLEVHAVDSGTLVRDLVSGTSVSLNGEGKRLFEGLRHSCSSYTVSEFLLRLAHPKSPAAAELCAAPTEIDNSCLSNIRLAKTGHLSEYLRNTALWRRLGNASFAAFMAGRPLEVADPATEYVCPKEPVVLYHSWRPGMLAVSERLSEVIRCADLSKAQDDLQHVNVLRRAKWLDHEPIDISMLVERAMTSFIAVQNRYELQEFLQRALARSPTVVVEIGTARGGLLYCLSQVAHPSALMISIDLPGASNCGGQSDAERELFRTFGPRGQRFEFLPADSRLRSTQEALARILGGREIDLLIIDGDHSYDGVRSDFESYKRFVAPGGWIVFHDIRLFPDEWGPGNEVGVFWREVRKAFHTREIVDPDGSCRRNPDKRPWSWGFGIVEF